MRGTGWLFYFNKARAFKSELCLLTWIISLIKHIVVIC